MSLKPMIEVLPEQFGHRDSFDRTPTMKLEPSFVPTQRVRTNTKDRVNDLATMRNELSKRNFLKCEHNVFYSGECDWPFTVRICQVENIMQILDSDSEFLEPTNRSTFNGMTPPPYITKQCGKTEEKKEEGEVKH